MKKNRGIEIFVLSLLMAACASVKKAELPAGANPTDELARLEAGVDVGFHEHYDILAKDEFEKSQRYLQEAREDFASNQREKEVLNNIAYGQAYLEQARAKAEERQPQLQGVLQARSAALIAGAENFPSIRDELTKLDDQVRKKADDSKSLKPAEFSSLQKKYLDLELAAIQRTQLGRAKTQIEGAKESGAKRAAPKALKQAELDLKNAENMILANRNEPALYSDAVRRANASAGFLIDVLVAADPQGEKLDEETATRIVLQNRQISSLEEALDQVQSEAEQNSRALAEQDRTLQNSAALVNLQQSLADVRKEFSEEEADVFQQDDKLIIRLKRMNFPSGRAELPAEALPTLSKITSVAETLGPQSVTIEGHADSTGDPNLNMQLSQERAEAVAQYLKTSGIDEDKIETVGAGFEKPIAANKTETGRAQNRRVDIIITPDPESVTGSDAGVTGSIE